MSWVRQTMRGDFVDSTITQLLRLCNGPRKVCAWSAAASWIAFLVSAISEYGLDYDFPLTPPLWLAIAVCAMLPTAVHAGVWGRTCANGDRLLRIHRSADLSELIHIGKRVLPGADSVPSSQAYRSLAEPFRRSVRNLYDFVGDKNESAPPLLLLHPATSRGPPRSCFQNVAPSNVKPYDSRPPVSTVSPSLSVCFVSASSISEFRRSGQPHLDANGFHEHRARIAYGDAPEISNGENP